MTIDALAQVPEDLPIKTDDRCRLQWEHFEAIHGKAAR